MPSGVEGAGEVYLSPSDRDVLDMPEIGDTVPTLRLSAGVSATGQVQALQPELPLDTDFGALDEQDERFGSDLAGDDLLEADDPDQPFTIPRQSDSEEVDDQYKTMVLDFDEATDFATSTAPKDKPLIVDPVDAYRQEIRNFTILEHEQVIERAKDLEIAKMAEQILSVNDAVDSPFENTLLEFRAAYIEARESNMRFSHKGKAGGAEADDVDEDDTGSSLEQADPAPTLSIAKQNALAAERVREEKHDLAIAEVDHLIAAALRYRVDLEPGKTELPKDVRAELEQLVEQGASAKSAMIESIGRYAFQLSQRYFNRAARVGMKPIDVVQEGNMGAIRSVEKFDWTKDHELAGYSAWWIKKSIQAAIERADEVRKPKGVAEMRAKIFLMEETLRAHLDPGETLTDEMVADALDITTKQIDEIRLWDQPNVSLDQRVGDGEDGGTTLGDYQDGGAELVDDVIAEDDRLDKLPDALEQALKAAIADDRIVAVLQGYFGVNEVDGNPQPQSELARRLGCSQMNISRLLKKGFAIIRDNEEVMQLLEELR